MNYIFVDESGDPGKPYKIVDGQKVATGASKFYIVTALSVTSPELFLLEQEIITIKHKYKFKKEIKSTIIPLPMYRDLLGIINRLKIKTFYRCVNKETYKGTFAVDGSKHLHNIFDEYNLAKTVYFTLKEKNLVDTEVVIDRADRRLLDNSFKNFDKYLFAKVNTKTVNRVKFITHANSEYVFLMQMSDLICGAVRDSLNRDNNGLKSVINKQLLRKVW